MLAEAIGRPLAVMVVRNGAPVGVIAEPTELARLGIPSLFDPQYWLRRGAGAVNPSRSRR